jgi:UPF0716 protein FxsA
MIAVLFVLLLLIPIAELYVIVQVAEGIGVVQTLVLLIVVSVVGTYLLRTQGAQTWNRLRETLDRGEMPAREITDGFLILLGGALLLTPGFLTDIVGLALVLPPSRALVRGWARRLLFAGIAKRYPTSAATIYTARVIRDRRREKGPAGDSNGPSSRRSSGELPPPEEPRADGGGSPGRG